ncbi:hypothetical protein CUR21_13330 [Pseudorhodobacter sp. MZDSW-24AT]|nr:hypothetical protein CUR21_13330 [Pseudorhodobacter sp. MZDSW-24AT]
MSQDAVHQPPRSGIGPAALRPDKAEGRILVCGLIDHGRHLDEIAKCAGPGAFADPRRAIEEDGWDAQARIAHPNGLPHRMPDGFGRLPHPWEFCVQGCGAFISLMLGVNSCHANTVLEGLEFLQVIRL